MSKVILVLVDALRDDVAAHSMGYLEHLTEAKRASRFTVVAELPTLSRPLYETVHTGLPVSEHGIVSNYTVRRSSAASIFSVAREHGHTTAAAAYCWYAELYVRHPYDLVADREMDDPAALIQHGRFYEAADYPDKELYATGALLMTRHLPDYLLIHPMGLDTVGHLYGGDSPQYRNTAIVQDQILANFIPPALALGYTVLVTGDHGMNSDKQHNGTLPDVRHVPLYIIAPPAAPADRRQGNTGRQVSQLAIAPTVLHLLGLPVPSAMRHAPLLEG
ncbi:MAG: alkaline phosphatase family protein [Anaerolineae bacterium]|jgi:predicted AlkP superfamily pyrophosphatase or phosphodiesterase|nr:alkaline phosphatase family protein [Anaerolineae bacterium]